MTEPVPLPLGHLPGTRYPDGRIEVLDRRFPRQGNAGIERVATGFRWAEGPVYFRDGGFLLWSDIPNNRIMQYYADYEQTIVYRTDVEFTNGRTLDLDGA
ncbi:MAG TPA: SMP-30/gluconolactonase/LRE family protein, partial [Stellaceae bacterium]|nr:SMP-30/gluconolactonase/LRE family protein [Stellaceae bacterium]